MFKRFGHLSLGALLAASVISHNSIAKAEMSARETIQMIELKGNVSAKITKVVCTKGVPCFDNRRPELSKSCA